jgi:hypothetical protein
MRRLPMLLSALLAAVLLAACGSSNSDSGSDQFRGQTKSALLDFGTEGDDAALEEGAQVVESFLAARAEGDWERACAQVSHSMLDKIEHLAATATSLADESCPSFLEAFVRISAKERKEGGNIDAGSMRRRGRQAYLIYYGGDKVVYAMPLSREGDAWKVASLAPKRLS